MTKAQYFRACMGQELLWLLHAAQNPSPFMRPIHVQLIRLAVRKRETL